MATGNTKFKIKPSPRSVSCKGCNVRILPGQLRIETVTGSGAVRNINHPGCFLGHPQGSSVKAPSDLDGWDQLSSDEQDTVRGLFPTTSSSNSPPSQSRPSVIINNPTVNSTSSQSTMAPQAQPSSSAMPITTTSQPSQGTSSVMQKGPRPKQDIDAPQNSMIDLTQAQGPAQGPTTFVSRNSQQHPSQNAVIDLTHIQGPPTRTSQSQSSSIRRNNSSSQQPLLSQSSHPSLSRAGSSVRSNQSGQSSYPSLSRSNSSFRSDLSRQSTWDSSQYSSQNTMIDLTDLDDSYDDYYDDDEDDYYDDSPALSLPSPKRPKLDRDSQGRPIMPNLLAGVTIPDTGRDRDGEECSVCLDPPLHPVTLPCGHVFCFTCAKGLTRQGASSACSLCRQDIPADYLDNSQVISEALEDVDKAGESSQQAWSWFYEGRNGWWKFEERNNEEIEETFLKGTQCLETLICGNLYVIDFTRMEQYQKNYPNRKRKIKRDLQTCDSKGIAGLSKFKQNSQPGGSH